MKKISHEDLYPTLEWCGIEWQQDMEGHRKIHPDYPNLYWSPDSSYIKMVDGQKHIILSIKEDPAQVHHWNGVDYFPKYAGSMIRSVNSFSYGTYELECILPQGRDLWPSFWLTHVNFWPPEIDVFEAETNACGGYWTWLAKVPFNIIRSGYKIETNIHWDSKLNGGDHMQAGARGCFSYIMNRPASTPIKYRLLWTPNEVSIYYNDVLVRHINDITHPVFFEQINEDPRMDIIINLNSPCSKSGKIMKDLKKNPDYESKFELINFTYKRLGSSTN